MQRPRQKGTKGGPRPIASEEPRQEENPANTPYARLSLVEPLDETRALANTLMIICEPPGVSGPS